MILRFLAITHIIFLSTFSSITQSEQLRLAVGLALPPYVISGTNSGIEMDIVREALAIKGHSIQPVYIPFARVPTFLADGKVDAALTVNERSGLSNTHFSDVHVIYQNVAVTLAKKNITIESINDLSPLSVIAFQDATKYLGPEFAKMAAANKRYSERAKQQAQITMLFSERVDSVVMDINIFKYFRNEEKAVDTSADPRIHEIFPPSLYKVGFKNALIRDQFNEALLELKSSGKYDKIIQSYIQ